MRFLSAAAFAALFAASPAFAADALVVPNEAMYTTSYEWNGFYAGVVGTAGAVTSTHDDVGYWMHGSTLDQAFATYGIGATAGFNFQDGSVVYGVEADISWLGGSEEVFRFDEVDYATSISALATIRGRVGIAVDNTLFYGTAGLAAASLAFDWDEDSGEFWNSDDWAFGYAVGAGVEYAVSDSMSVKAEYLFTAVEGQTVYINDGGIDEDYPFGLSATASLFRAGLNFKF